MTKRCAHGFLGGANCVECKRLRRQRARMAANVRAASLRPVCAICERIGHVSKVCPSTAIGRERLARKGVAA